jgi:hypothetical protein
MIADSDKKYFRRVAWPESQGGEWALNKKCYHLVGVDESRERFGK